MSRLLDLYPRAWRERYGDELAELIELRPLTVGGRFDMLRGALDAHLHPGLLRVRRTAGAGPAPAMPVRLDILTPAHLAALRSAGPGARARRRYRRVLAFLVAVGIIELLAAGLGNLLSRGNV